MYRNRWDRPSHSQKFCLGRPTHQPELPPGPSAPVSPADGPRAPAMPVGHRRLSGRPRRARCGRPPAFAAVSAGVSTVTQKGVILDGSSTPTCRGSGLGHRRQEPVWRSVRGAGVKAVSPAKRGRSGATRLDAGEHTRTLTVRRCLSATTTSGGRRKVRILHHDQCRVMTSGARRGRRRSGLRVSCACHNQSLARKVSREESALNRGVR